MKPNLLRRVLLIAGVVALGLSALFIYSVYKSTRLQNTILQDFVGDYYLGDGLGLGWFLTIYPDSTFALTQETDVGPYDRYTGSIVLKANGVQLIAWAREVFMRDAGFGTPINGDVLVLSSGLFSRDETHNLIPVKWGQRRYLVFADRIPEFCRDEPRGIATHGYNYLRVGDWRTEPAGKPIAPDDSVMCP